MRRSKLPLDLMTGFVRAALVAAAVLSCRPAVAEPVRFTISDHLSPGQVQEDISVFLGGRLAGTLHIDAQHPQDEIAASAEASDHYDFALCGTLVRDSGNPPEHRIDDAGTLADVAGRTFAAITIKDTLFTLQDVTEGRPPVVVVARPGPACAPTIASR